PHRRRLCAHSVHTSTQRSNGASSTPLSHIYRTGRSSTKSKRALTRGFHGGRYWDRTSDLFRVREARYRCANRPCSVVRGLLPRCEVTTGFEPVYTALQAVASPLGHATVC